MARIESLQWRELLTPVEIQHWLSSGKAPKRLRKDFSCAGVYRFTFPTASDGAASHTACYVGEATNLSSRIRKHFQKPKPAGRRIKWKKKLKPGWELRGRIQSSQGDFKLETLKLEGRVSFGGFTFGPESFADPYDNFFLRKMLENWAVLASEHGDDLYPLNRRATKAKNIFKELARNFLPHAGEDKGLFRLARISVSLVSLRLALPTGAYYTWKDTALEGSPIEPDVVSEFDWQDRRRGNDRQLAAALNTVSNGISM